MTQTTPDDHAPGTLEQLADGRWRLRFTRVLAHPPERVWRAISEPEELAAWFPSSIDGDREPGAPLRFTFPGEIAPPMDGVMVAYEPPTLMELQWGPDAIRIELEPHAEGTLLTLLDTLEAQGKAARDGAGWHVCLDSLRAHLAGRPAAHEETVAWREVHPHYLESFGPEAATIGPPEGFE